LSPRDTPPYGTVDSHSATIANSQVPHQSTVQLGKLTLEPFSGDITQFQRFWRAFEVAIHDDVTISTTYKFLYLQRPPQGRRRRSCCKDLDPDECNYYELVRALKKRYDRPHKTRATLHKQLQQLPTAATPSTTPTVASAQDQGHIHREAKFLVVPFVGQHRIKRVTAQSKFQPTHASTSSKSLTFAGNAWAKVIHVAAVGPQVAAIAQEVITNFYANTVHVKNDRVVALAGTILTSRADTTTTAAGENTVRLPGTDIHQEAPHKEAIVAAITPTAIAQDLHLGRTVAVIIVHGLTLQQGDIRVRPIVSPSIHHRAAVNTTVP
ncbi:hypothetical protein OSTOST_17284, partial [Ostertagia ostertagi]